MLALISHVTDMAEVINQASRGSEMRSRAFWRRARLPPPRFKVSPLGHGQNSVTDRTNRQGATAANQIATAISI